MAQIKGKVAKIIDDYSVLINVGSQHGVTNGMRFVIYEEGEEVLDPDTGESLGAWEVVKGQVVAQHVQERITLAGAPPEEAKSVAVPVSSLMAEVSKGRSESDSTLNVKRSDLSGRPHVGPVAIGDHVRSID